MGAASGLNESAKTFTEILGPTWGKVCEEYGNGRLVWAHDGINIAGWVELAAAGVLLTISFRNGVWELSSCDEPPREYVHTAFAIRRTGHVSFVLGHVYSSGCSDRQVERDPIEASGAKAHMPRVEIIGHPCVLRSPAIGMRKRKSIYDASRISEKGGLQDLSQWASSIR